MKRFVPIILVLAACTESSTGTLRVRANGEAAAVAGYPVTVDGETFALDDDFTITFEHVYVGLDALTLETSGGKSSDFVADPVLVDLHDGPQLLWEDAVPAQRWDRVSYRTKVPASEDRVLATIDAETLDAMRTGGFALYVIGTAAQGGDTFTFSLGFPPKQQSRCENGDGTEGVVVTPNAVTEAEVTIHLDHLFSDSLAAEAPAMRFEPFAAAAMDGEITLDGLTQPITDLRDRSGDPIMHGDAVVVYDPGPYAISPSTLEQYVLAAASTMGHWNGEGHCDYAPVE